MRKRYPPALKLVEESLSDRQLQVSILHIYLASAPALINLDGLNNNLYVVCFFFRFTSGNYLGVRICFNPLGIISTAQMFPQLS